MGIIQQTGRAQIAWYNDDETIEVAADVTFVAIPYDKGDRLTPPSGGGLEDVRFAVQCVKIWGPSGDVAMEISGNMAFGRWAEELDRLYEHADPKFRERVNEECYRAWAEANERCD